MERIGKRERGMGGMEGIGKREREEWEEWRGLGRERERNGENWEERERNGGNWETYFS